MGLSERLRALLPAAACVLLLGVAGLALVCRGVPTPLGLEAAPDEFSAERAMVHVEAMARAPHPMGSAEHARVRGYLLETLRELGLEPQVQTAAVSGGRYAVKVTGTVHNVMARLPGTEGGPGTPAVVLACHYDSVSTGPGAGDDAAGCAALLETARALQTQPPLRNDVIFLFTDGEELGYLGALAFEREHPWARDAAVLLNFEARGNQGPSFMFETGRQDGALLREFAAVPHPVGSSLAVSVFELMPNGTDFGVLTDGRTRPGLDFAFIGNDHAYHTRMDDPARLSRASLQHHGSYALALGRRLGQLDLSTLTPEPNPIYFDLAGRTVVSYPSWLVWPLTAGAVVLLLVVVARARRRERASLGGVFASAGLLTVALLVNTALTAGLCWFLLGAVPRYTYAVIGGTAADGTFRLAVSAVGLALTWFLLRGAVRRSGFTAVGLGALSVWIALLVLVSALLPGGSYLLLWPCVVLLAGWLWTIERGAADPSDSARAGLLLLALLGVVFLVPATHDLMQAMTLGLTAAAAPLVVLGAGLFVPALAPRSRLPWLALAAGASLGLAGLLVCWFGDDEPRPTSLSLAVDTSADDPGQARAVYFSLDPQLDDYTRGVVPAGAERGDLLRFWPVLQLFTARFAPAEGVPAFQPPQLEVLDDSRDGPRRSLRLRLTSPRGADAISFLLLSDVVVHEARVEGLRISDGGPPARLAERFTWGIVHMAPPADGIEVRLVLEGGDDQPLRVHLLDLSQGLAGRPWAPGLPMGLIPSQFPHQLQDAVFVGGTLELPGSGSSAE
jgi:Peptidase family M28